MRALDARGVKIANKRIHSIIDEIRILLDNAEIALVVKSIAEICRLRGEFKHSTKWTSTASILNKAYDEIVEVVLDT